MPTILLCMHNGTAANHVSGFLREAKYQVVRTESIDESFQLLSEVPEGYDLVCLTFGLRGGSFDDLVKRCADHPQTAHLPFLMLASLPNTSKNYHVWRIKPIKYEFFENGRDACICIPCQKEDILSAVRAVLERQTKTDIEK